MKRGYLVLIGVGILLLASVGIGSSINSARLNNQLSSCENSAHQDYQNKLASNPYAQGSQQWTEWNDNAEVIYIAEFNSCQNNYSSGMQATQPGYTVGILVGIVLIGIGVYRWRKSPPIQPKSPAALT